MEIITRVTEEGKVKQLNLTTGEFRFLLPRKTQFNNFDDFIDFLYEQERVVPWYSPNHDDGLAIIL